MMGATESVLICQQDVNELHEWDIVKTYSSLNCKDVLRLYKLVNGPEEDENQVNTEMEENLFSSQTFVIEQVWVYPIVLLNQYNDKVVFQLSVLENTENGLKKFEEFIDILSPYIDDFPSIYTEETLTSLIKLRRTYPSWSVVQVAEYLKLPELMTKVPKNRMYTRQESQHQQEALEMIKREHPSFARDFFGSTPLQFLTERHPELVANLVSAIDSLTQTGKDLKDGFDAISKYTESPIHVAIRLSQESVLKLLLEKGANPLIPCGHAYPIHLSLKHESKGCTRLLLEHDKSCLQLRDKKYNASVLHWVKNSQQIDLLTQLADLDLNERNFERETPLHIMIQRRRLAPCISLICHGADVNSVGKNGTTPLHYAVMKDDVDIIRALLFLGANLSVKDDDQKIPRDYLNEDTDNYQDICDLFSLFSYNQSEKVLTERRTKSLLKEKTGKESLLTFDGGGIRGLVLTEVLLALEALTGHCTYDLFDWVSGTSTGSFLAMSIANGRSVRSCQLAYLRLGRSCLVGIRPYPTEQLDKFLIEEFGKDTKMDLYAFPSVIIPAVVADRRPAMLNLFRNYNAPYDEHYTMRDARFPRPPLPPDQTMWLAIRSSCSAPSYFRSTGRYLDGGLIANNPTLDALSEIHKHEKYFNTVPKSDKETGHNDVTNLKVILSIGTGRPPLQLLRPIDLYRPSSVWDTAEIVDNLKGFVDLMVDQVSASDDHVVDRTRSWCEMTNIEYFRYQPTLSSDIELNETDDRTLLLMLCDVRKYILKHMENLKRLSKLLLGEDV